MKQIHRACILQLVELYDALLQIGDLHFLGYATNAILMKQINKREFNEHHANSWISATYKAHFQSMHRAGKKRETHAEHWQLVSIQSR